MISASDPLIAPQQVIVLFSYEYVNLPAVHAHLQMLKPASFHIASKNGLGRTLLLAHEYDAVPIKWTPTYNPLHLTSQFDRALLFWDGSDHILKPSVEFFDKHQIPYVIVGPDAKVVAPSRFYATFSNGDTPKMPPVQAPSAPAPVTIVDAPKVPEAYGQPNSPRESRTRVILMLPDSLFHQYEEQSAASKQPVEKILADRLRTCVEHTSGRGLYFNSEQRATLERVTGGHLIQNADVALQKIQTVVNLKVADVDIELTERVLARCASRAKSERKTLEAYVKKEVILGLERVTGLRPW